MHRFLAFLFQLPRLAKVIILLAYDSLMVSLAFWLAYIFRVGWQEAYSYPHLKTTYLIVLPWTLFCFVGISLYRAISRYSGLRTLWAIAQGSFVSTILFVAVAKLLHTPLPRSIPILYFLLLLVFMSSSRLLVKAVAFSTNRKYGKPVIIYGAGEAGRQLLEALQRIEEYYPVALVDDDRHLQKTIVENLSIYPPEQLGQLIKQYGVKSILLALPSATRQEKNRILQRLAAFPCEVLSVPGIKDLVDGTIHVAELKKLSVLDLLGREPVPAQEELLAKNIAGKNVLVTGAGGSIGSELCRQILGQQPHRLILFEVNEYALYTLHRELSAVLQQQAWSVELIPLLGTVTDQEHLVQVMCHFAVETVYHAAAYKHVPLVEGNPVAGVYNNVIGTLHCALAATEAHVAVFVLISTDKAVRPTNVMGASKRMAELILQGLAAEPGQQTCFCMVRFGNVLGSSGSVIPLFEQQIAQGGPVTLTHPEITRFFMSIPEAAQLVIQAGAMGKGGDVFVLDMGESVKIMDLARRMIQLSGYGVKNETGLDGDIEIQITGLRPGEKLYEEVLIGEHAQASQHPRIMYAQEIMLSWPDLVMLLAQIQTACRKQEAQKVRDLLLSAPLEYEPQRR